MSNINFNEKYGYDEITLTRDDLAEVMSTTVAKVVKGAPDDVREMISEVTAVVGALIMDELFDKHEEIEIE